MKKTIFSTLPLLFLLAPQTMRAQSSCDTLALRSILDKSYAQLDEGQLQAALDLIVPVLPTIETCEAAPLLCEEVQLQADACYQALAMDFIQRGQFNRGIDLAERCIALHRQLAKPNPDRLAKAYQLLSSAQNLNGNPRLAIDYAQKALEIRQAANPMDPKMVNHFDAIIANAIALNDTALARVYLVLWGKHHQKVSPRVSLQARVTLANYWSMYFEAKGEIRQAIQVLEDTLGRYGEQLKAKGGFLGIAEFHLCELHTQAKNFAKALSYSEKNVAMFEERLRLQKGKLFGRSHYAWCLAQSARSAWHLYLENNDSTWQRLAEHRCEQAENEVFNMRDRAPNDGFREWIANEIGIVSNIAEVRQGLFAQTADAVHAERAFEAIEASKSSAIQEFLHETYALRWSGLPDSLYLQENDYRQRVNELETNFFMFRNLPSADSLMKANDVELFALRDQYRMFLNELAQKHPDYFRLKYCNLTMSIPQVQSQILAPGQCLLDMYLDNDKVFLMLLRQDTLVWVALPLEEKFEKALDLLAKESRQFNQYQSLPEQTYIQELQAYADAAFQVYQTLIAPVRSLMAEEVLLIPRDRLANIPFGALLTQRETNMGKPFQWHYLDNELVLSQAYAVGMFQFVQSRKAAYTPDKTVLAMAPFFEGKISDQIALPAGEISGISRSATFAPLPNSGTEALDISKQAHGDALLGANATKSALLEAYQHYKILHFATHSAVNEVLGEYSYVALHGETEAQKAEMLYAKDIYSLRIPADLVVLSACETALGQYRKDEGVVGLTRAFTCAGARNVVASLWPVSDVSTQRLMSLFYQEIQSGKSYNRALCHAKRTFIKANRSNALPYYWAGFVLHGR